MQITTAARICIAASLPSTAGNPGANASLPGEAATPCSTTCWVGEGWGGQPLRSTPGPYASEHTRKVVGLVLVQRGHVPACMLSRTRPESIASRNAGGTLGMLNGFRAAQTVCVQVCLTNLYTADTTSALLEYGIGRMTHILLDLLTWMEEHEYESVTSMKGSMSQRAVAEPAAFERANYMK